ncbi:GNAT family N-acetyltransferase [Dactylosporangium fulvum]|uniref:GNAT family N-acetyltransferase n=1 Tax=Dactylosporangium fulvum TaxID=53359 RepID=A0ABY5W448_9ACTN|nr:GNAT family N-acetyltransferase [Dactylosporangium fulvum]UWP84745.1 GNAT family N-acetyltransferase [Dactylosporangium fulvum]
MLTYEVDAPGLEIVTVDAPARRQGVGTALLEAAREVAVRSGVRRVWLITTNDNLDALRFYQRRGMRITRAHPGAVQRARLHKPAIPVVGDYGITLHDELELELLMTPEGAPPVHVRPGTLADVTPVLALLDDATEWLVGLGRTGQWGTEPHSTNPRRVAAMMRWATQGQLYVAESGGAVVGGLAVGAAQEWVPAVDEPELYVNLLVTDRTRKGDGLGGVLLDHARALAVQRGLGLLRVDCYGGDDRALVGWYERQGLTPSARFTVPRPDGTEWPGQVLEQRLR